MIPSRRIKNIFTKAYRVGTTLKKSRIFFETRSPSKKIYYNIFERHNSEPFPIVMKFKKTDTLWRYGTTDAKSE